MWLIVTLEKTPTFLRISVKSQQCDKWENSNYTNHNLAWEFQHSKLSSFGPHFKLSLLFVARGEIYKGSFELPPVDECALISNKNLNTSFVYKTASYKVMENCPSGLCAGMSYQQSPVDLSYQANPKLQFEKSNIPLLEIRSGKVREQHCDIEWLCAGMPCQQSPP